MYASAVRRLHCRGEHDPKPPAFLPLPLLPRDPTPPPPLPSSPPHPIPPLSFRHLSPCPRWCAWVATALRDLAFAPVLASAAISDAVAASTATVAPDRPALSALLSLWDPATHAFRLPAGPATFTLEDALVLAGLPPSGAPLDRPLTPDEEDLRIRLVIEKEKIMELHPCARAARRVSAEVWLEWFDGSGIRPGEDDELRRLGFFAYWLAFFVTPWLRARSVELPERVFALAARLSLGERIALGPAMVANLYADMDKIVTFAVADRVSGRIDVRAPLWLLQVWMWERYKRLRPPQLKAPQFPISSVRVLHWSQRKRTSTPEEALQVLLDEACFDWRPYLYNSLNWMEPKWFNVDSILVSCRGEDKPEWLVDYIAIIRQTVLTGWYGDNMDNSVLYNPHLVARQFGYDQAVPVSIIHEFESEGIEFWIPSIGRHGMASDDYVAWCSGRFHRHQDTDRYGCLVIPNLEIRATSLQLNANKKSSVEAALAQFREVTAQEDISYIGEEQLAQVGNGIQENKAKVIVLGLGACDKDYNAAAVKWNKEKKKRRDKFAEDGGSRKTKSNVSNKIKKSSLQLEAQKYSVFQEDLNSDSMKCDELAERCSDDECIVLEQHDKKCETINLDDDEEQSALDLEYHHRQLVVELEEFVRSGLLSQWEESSDEDEGSGRKQETLKNSNIDPYAEAAMREYPLFFDFIPQKPHYRGLVNNDEALGDLAYSGLWFLLVGLAKEVLKTTCDTDASDIAYLMRKAQHLEQLGFNVKHLIARLKEPQIRHKRLQDSRARLEDAQKKEQEAKGVQSLSSHLSKLKNNIRTMERHLDENKQAFVSSVPNKLNEGIDLVSLEKEVEAAEKYCQAMKDEVAAMRMNTDI
ncbi:uncharacterized protein LOC133902915 [Phragmites australis]|uniref:uncharacterized protein LOC133902915 n=1 Tax=Phragmites australis TaxID=29695 RepID=UPI002D78B2A4|nr:uncharacterized protein LOC133902915 [Phragmites australis]